MDNDIDFDNLPDEKPEFERISPHETRGRVLDIGEQEKANPYSSVSTDFIPDPVEVEAPAETVDEDAAVPEEAIDWGMLPDDPTRDVREVMRQNFDLRPDEYAEADKIAKDTGLPVGVVVRNRKEVLAQLALNEAGLALQDDPELAMYMAANESFTVKAKDDLPAITSISSLLQRKRILDEQRKEITGLSGSTVARIPGALVGRGFLKGSVAATAEGAAWLNDKAAYYLNEAAKTVLPEGATDFLAKPRQGAPTTSNVFRSFAEGASALSDVVDPQRPDDPFVLDAIGVVGQVAGDLLSMWATGGMTAPAVTANMRNLGIMFAQGVSGGVERTKGEEWKDMSQEARDRAVLTYGLITAVTALPALDKIVAPLRRTPSTVSDWGARRIATDMAVAGAAQGAQTLAEQYGYDLADFGMNYENASFHHAQNLRAAAVATVGGSLPGGISSSAGALRFRDTLYKMQDAQEFTAQLNQVLKAANAVEMRKHSPEDFGAAMQEIADGAEGGMSSVFVDSKEFAQAIAQIPAERRQALRKAMPETFKRMQEAEAEDVEIPVGELLSGAAGTEIEPVLMQLAKSDPEGLSAKDASAVLDEAGDLLQSSAEEITKQLSLSFAEAESSERVREAIHDQIVATGHDLAPDAATLYSTLMGSFFTAQAQKQGITAEELYRKYPVRIASAPMAPQFEALKGAVHPTTLNAVAAQLEVKPRQTADQLTTEQRSGAEAALAPAIEAATRSKPEFDTKVAAIAANVGGEPLLTPIKDIGRAAEKLVVENGGDVSTMKDLVRATVVINDPADAPAALAQIKENFEVLGVKDRYAQPTAEGYRDMLVNVKLADGVIAEIQVNTPAGLAAKEVGHALYAEHRSLPDGDPRKAKIEELMKRLYTEAADSEAKALNLASDTATPSSMTLSEPGEYGRTPVVDSATVEPSGSLATAIESTSKNSVPGGNVESGIANPVVSDEAILAQSDLGLDIFLPENIANLVNEADWSILTAADPGATKASDADNAAAMQSLRADLEAQGLAYTGVTGKYGDVQESLAVVGISEADALALGRKYGQESVLTPRGLVYSDGRVTPSDGTIEVFDQAPEDFYTEVPGLGVYFSLGLDFDATTEPGVFAQSKTAPEGAVSESAQRAGLAGGGLVPFSLASNSTHSIPAKEISRWNGQVSGFAKGNPAARATLRTGAALVDAGVTEGRVELTGARVNSVRAKHPDVAQAVIDNLPQLLANPMMVLPTARGGVEAYVNATGAGGAPMLVAIQDGRVTTIHPVESTTAETSAQRIANRVGLVMGKPGSRVYLNSAEDVRALAGDVDIKPGRGVGVTYGDKQTRSDSFAQRAAALPGAPQVTGATGPIPALVAVAESYMAERGLPFNTQAEYVQVDEARAKRIADAYEKMKHEPNNPKVKAAYADMIKQVRAQYDAVTEAGYSFFLHDETNDPYNGNPWNAMRAVRKDKVMGVFATEAGFGSEESDTVDTSDNPLNVDTGLKWPWGSPDGPLRPVMANDLFRAVHDLFGHGLEGAGFRARGEENAWQAHARMFTGSALGAMTSETRGQNSWLNYGPHGETNRAAKVEDTIFAEQKTGLMPEWTWTEGVAPDVAPGELAQRARGTFNPDTLTIKLLKDADLSTFLHESGHFFLEVLADMAQAEDSSEATKADMAAVLEWFGVENLDEWQAMSLDEQRPHHERFAESFEQYLFEGKAPSAELRGAFRRFRDYLIEVYTSMTQFMKGRDLQLSDEVRGVFDRLIASREQIAESEQDAGMPYNNEASNAALERLAGRSVRDLKWVVNARSRYLKRLQADIAAKRKEMREEVTAEVRSTPGYAVQRYIRNGELWRDGEMTKADKPGRISRKGLIEIFGDGPEAVWRQLPESLLTNNEDNAVPAQMLAESFGLRDTTALVEQILFSSNEAQTIDEMTSERLLEEHGDIVTEKGMQEAANEAVHNEARARFVATQMKGMRELAGAPYRGTNLLLRAAKESALGIVGRKRVMDLRPSLHTNAERSATRQSDAAQSRGDTAAALRHRQDQLLHHYAARYTSDARTEVASKVNYLKKFDKPGVREKLPKEYRDQIDALLERVDLRISTSRRDIARRRSLGEWIEDQQAQGLTPVVPDSLLGDSKLTSYKQMTMDDFRELVDAVRNIEHLGRLKDKLLTARDKRNFDAVVDGIVTDIETNRKGVRKAKLDSPGRFARAVKAVGGFAAHHRKLGSYITQLDGGKVGGKFWDALLRPMNDASVNEAVMQEKAGKELDRILKPLFGGRLKNRNLSGSNLRKRVYIESIGESLALETRMAIALNYGTELGRQRLRDGDRLSDLQLQEAMSTLTQEQLKVVSGIWAHLETYWDSIKAQEEATSGVTPERVDAAAFTVESADGRTVHMRGGYYPLKYDADKSSITDAHNDAEIAKNQLRGAYIRSTTRHGFTKARADTVSRSVRKDLGVLFQHITEVTHNLAWQSWLIDANKLLGDNRIDNAIRETLGPSALREMKRTLPDIAAGDVPAQEGTEIAAQFVRNSSTIAGLGWNLFTGLLQPIGFTQSIVRVGPKWFARGASHFLGGAAKMENRAKEVYEKSDFMRMRSKVFNREIREINAQVKGQTTGPLGRSYFMFITGIQKIVDLPTWYAGYEKAIAEGRSEQDAVIMADQMVKDTQGSGFLADLSGVQRGSHYKKMFTNFYNFFNTTYNLMAESYRTKDFPAFAADFLLLTIAPATLSWALSEALRSFLGGDDREPEDMAKGLAQANASYILGMMVGLRDFGSLVNGYNSYSGPSGLRLIGDVFKSGGVLTSDKAGLNLDTAIGVTPAVAGLFHLPAGAIVRSMRGLKALNEGDTENPAALVLGPPRR